MPVCGDTASRHGEVLSFRLLASRVLARTGGAADGTLDAGGKLLMMQRALQEALPSLTVYARPSRKAPFWRSWWRCATSSRSAGWSRSGWGRFGAAWAGSPGRRSGT